MWALVPEVVTYGEYTTGRRVAATVNALICIFMKAGMALGGVIPGLVLAWVGFDAAIFVIGKYELSDERMDQINSEISKR
jgi:GPH family glycoside/pentoside/hexuronide:cation symporter